jgi:hypothetical protein
VNQRIFTAQQTGFGLTKLNQIMQKYEPLVYTSIIITARKGYIWIAGRRQAIEFKNVHEIIELSMNVTTNCKFAVFRNCNMN